VYFSQDDPFLPVDWRWQRAVWLSENQRNVRRLKDKDDPFIQTARRFRLRWNSARRPGTQIQLSEQFPGIYYAWQLYRRNDQDDRWNVEARLLAGQSLDVIAKRQKCKLEVIFWFEKLFFNVSDKLEHRDYIVNRVLGPAVHRGISERDFDLLLKLFALVGGPLVVDVIMENNSRIGKYMQEYHHADAYFSELAASVHRRKAATAAYCIPVNLQTQMALMDGHTKLLELEKDREQLAGNTEGLLKQSIADALAAVPFWVTSSKNPPTLPLMSVVNGAVELTGAERMAAQAGVEPAIDDEFRTFRIPANPGESHEKD